MEATLHTIENQALSNRIMTFFHSYKIGRQAYRVGMKKAAGVPVPTLLLTLFTLPFERKNLYSYFIQNNTAFQKDTLYSLLRLPTVNWRLFLQKIVISVVIFLRSTASENKQHALIIDDSLLERPRAKKVELCSRVYDHVLKRFTKGFRFLCLGWTDGDSFLPIDFAILASKKEKNILKNATKNLDPRTIGAKRRKEARRPAPVLAAQMLARAKAWGIKAGHVLMDAWFGTPAVITSCAKHYPVICMVKKTPKIHYVIEQEAMTLQRIYRVLKKRTGRAKWLASTVVTLKTGIPARLVYVRNRNKSKEWLALLSTDTTLPEEEVIRLYGLRWDIEVFFRTVKQHLAFGKDFQGRDFDAIVAYSAIVMLRYIFLSLEQRQQKDPRTLGLLFQACCEEQKNLAFMDALVRILRLSYPEVLEKYAQAEVIASIFEKIIGVALEFYGFLPKNTGQGVARAA